MRRVLKSDGQLLITVPNLAHLNSRTRLLVRGRLDRTDIETNHVAERPLWENERLIRKAGFEISDKTGITLTIPFVYRRVICRNPARFRWLHDLFEPVARRLPSLATLTVFTRRNSSKSPE